MMPAPYVEGFLLGGSLIIAIGAQNAYVLSLGISRNHHLASASLCAIIDISLIALGVAGVGSWMQANPGLLKIALWGGAAFLFLYGLSTLRSAVRGEVTEVDASGGFVSAGRPSLRTVAFTTLAVSLFNPHVYLDTVVLMGSLSGKFAGSGRFLFALGASTASVIWFYSLAFAGQILAPALTRPAA
ncbi:MAG: LysE family transporter [bacterium]|nr:LysE family transporter [bacterium]